MKRDSLASSLLAGDRRALARALTYLENGGEIAKELAARIFAHTGRAQIIGVTGAPGTGKSTLVNALAQVIRAEGEGPPVAILAVDPSSPFTGGAIMGDRVRMRSLAGDNGIFIRSMAARGNPGGLASGTRDALRALDAAGFPIILLETVGAGQGEVEVVKLAQTILVVEAPGLGDDVQAIKAGLLEIADIFVVNKADRPGASKTANSLQQMLDLGHPGQKTDLAHHHGEWLPLPEFAPANAEECQSWAPPILRTTANRGVGIEQLWATIQEHRVHLQRNNILKPWWRAQLAGEIREKTADAIVRLFWEQLDEALYAELLDQLEQRAIDPGYAVECILDAMDLPPAIASPALQAEGS